MLSIDDGRLLAAQILLLDAWRSHHARESWGNSGAPLTARPSVARLTQIMLLLAVELYTYVVLASVILSWVRLEPSNPFVKFVNALTEPVLKPIRAVMPSFMGLDFSPLALLLALSIIRRFL